MPLFGGASLFFLVKEVSMLFEADMKQHEGFIFFAMGLNVGIEAGSAGVISNHHELQMAATACAREVTNIKKSKNIYFRRDVCAMTDEMKMDILKLIDAHSPLLNRSNTRLFQKYMDEVLAEFRKEYTETARKLREG